MGKTPTTQSAIDRLVGKPGRYRLGPGLFFRVLPHSKAYYVFRFSLSGKEREMSLGPHPEITLAEANIRHAEMRAKVKSGKLDPLAERDAAKKAAVAATTGTARTKPTFGQIADDRVATHEASWRNALHVAQWKSTLGPSYCAAIRDLPVDEIDTTAVLRVLKPIWSKTPETASRLRGRIETVLDAARALGLIDEDKANPARWKGHLNKLLPNPKKIGERGHHKAMPYAELPAFMSRLKEIDRVAARALRFLILTGARSGEVFGATFSEIDLEPAVWRIPAGRMKMNRPHEVPLSSEAIEIIQSQLATRGEKQVYVFESPLAVGAKVHRKTGSHQPLSAMSLTMLLRRMGVDATAHGMRSAFRDWAADTGVEFSVAEAALAHSLGSAVTAAYLRTTMLERRRPVMQAWADFIDGKTSHKVVDLAAARGKREAATTP